MNLIKLKDEDLKEFKKLMQEAFQYGYESVYGKSKEQILPEKDIDNDLDNKNSYAYELVENDKIIGGVVVTINEKTIGEDDNKGLRKRIKELENYINANIPVVTIPMTSYYSSYIKFEEHVDARQRPWGVYCATCNGLICKYRARSRDGFTDIFIYNGTLDDLISKVNSSNIPIAQLGSICNVPSVFRPKTLKLFLSNKLRYDAEHTMIYLFVFDNIRKFKVLS